MCIDYFDRESLERWFKDKGDETHRLNYKIDKNSKIFDIGGYEGDWSNSIYSRYGSIIYIFEPIKKNYDFICNRFKNTDCINIYNYALSNKNEFSDITLYDASSSFYITDGIKEKIEIRNINDIIDDLKIDKIDIMKINIEGSEYDLLEAISDDNINKVNNFQIQFHKIGNDYESRRNDIRKRLSKTHSITFDYKFVWENWKKNDSN